MMDSLDLRRMRDGWSPPAGLERTPPRPVRMTGAGVAVVVTAVLLAAGAVTEFTILSLRASGDSARTRRLLAEGRATTGAIVRVYHSTGKHTRHTAVYEFDVAGETFRRSAPVSSAAVRQLARGAPVAVRYLPDNPSESRLPEYERPSGIPLWLGPLIALPLLFTAGLLGRRLAARRRLLEEGRAAPAIVTGYGIKSDKGREVRYEFPTLSGARKTGKYGPVQNSKLPALGDRLVIVYDPNEPECSARYPLELFAIRA